MYQDPLLCFVLREIGRWVVSEFVEKDSKLLKKKKRTPRSSRGIIATWFITGITVSVCAYIYRK